MLNFGSRRKLLSKTILLAFVKCFCFVMILIQSIQMTIDFLKFSYNYELNVIDIKNGFDYPSISLCTESNVFFNKEKVIKNFNLKNEFDFYIKKIDEIYDLKFIFCNNDSLNEESFFESYMPRKHGCRMINREKFYYHSKFLQKYEKIIFDEFSFDQMQSLTITAKELFKCSANIHFINQSFRSIDNCFDYFNINQIIYANNDFGICFSFFAKNYSIFIEDNDNIKITLNYDQERDLMANGIFLDSYEVENYYRLKNDYQIHDIDYFKFYLLVNNGKPFRRIDAIESNRVGYHAYIKFSKFIVENIQSGLVQLNYEGMNIFWIYSFFQKHTHLNDHVQIVPEEMTRLCR